MKAVTFWSLSPCAIQDRGVSAGLSERRGLPVVCHRGEEQLDHQPVNGHWRRREGPGQWQRRLRVSSTRPDRGWLTCDRGETCISVHDSKSPSTPCAAVLARRLNVQGRRAELSQPSPAELDGRPGGCGVSGQEKPTVIEAEGLMEEYLAFDSRDL